MDVRCIITTSHSCKDLLKASVAIFGIKREMHNQIVGMFTIYHTKCYGKFFSCSLVITIRLDCTYKLPEFAISLILNSNDKPLIR
jgi:hypothetical protein